VNIHDLTPEERDVYRQAFAHAVCDDIPFPSEREALDRGEMYGSLAVLRWRLHLEEQMKAAVKESDNELG
jgi:hypothetical protein